MAVLSKIRQRSVLLIGIIAFALLAFIVQDLFSNGFRSQSTDVGSINGKDIPFDDFRLKVSNTEQNARQQGQNITNIQAVEQVWSQEIALALLSTQFENAGIRTGQNHIIETFKKDPNIGQNPTFLNELGKFDYNKFNEYFNSNPSLKDGLAEREKDAIINSKFQIYSALIRGGMFTTTTEAKFKYEMETNKVNFEYVSIPYSTIKDSDIKVSDEDITAYIQKNEKRFKSDGTREIEYVIIEDAPSKEDQAEIKAKMDALLAGSIVYNSQTGKNDTLPSFRNSSNVAEFIAANSDTPYDSICVTKQDLPAEFADALYNLPAGDIYGPYVNGKYYSISKSMGKKANAKAKASHILISYEGTQVPNKKEKRTKEEAKVKAESLLAQAQANPSSFMMLALTNSDDSSSQQGGDLGYFGPNQMVKPFNDFVFSNPVGKIGLVETEYGFHIINVTDKQDAVKLATVSQKIDASEATSNEAYTKATKFEMESENKDFAAAAKKQGLTVMPSFSAKPMDENVGTLGSQRQIVKWAYQNDTKAGDIKRFEVVNVGNVVVTLKKINKKGLMSVEDARPMVENVIKNQKKAEKIIASIKGSDLNAIAKANKTTVQTVADVTIENPNIPNAGNEGKVIGAAFGTALNKVSAPIEGNTGVFVVKKVSVVKAPKIAKYNEYVTKLQQNSSQSAGRVLPALKEKADIEDSRVIFY
ncbi:MAG: peptidyl-prolyl cis-trans isomerase D [Flavobacterium sp.]|jgi:peptidyl-prolyl cis-trans isomerase D